MECGIPDCSRPVHAGGYCNRHYLRLRRTGDPLGSLRRPARDRFWVKVNRSGPPPVGRDELGPCWLWTGYVDTTGYGKFRYDGVTGLAHRYAYELLVGPIAEGLHLDHLCRVKACVNPAHLEPVTPRENVLRGEAPAVALHHKGVCSRGHPATDENVYRRKSTGRIVYCRPCRRDSDRRTA